MVNPSNKIDRRKNFALIIICVLLLVSLIATYWAISAGLSGSGPMVANNGRISSVAESVYEYLSKNFRSEDSLFLNRMCESGICKLEDEAPVGGYAWYMLPHARKLALSRHLGEEDAFARENLDWAFKKWRSKQIEASVYSLHQLFASYRLTGEEQFIQWFFNGLVPAKSYYRVNVEGKDFETQIEPFLAAALAWQFSDGAWILATPSMLDVVYKGVEGKKPSGDMAEELRQDYLNAAEGIISLLKTRNDSYNEPYLVPGSKNLPQFVCWTYLAELSAARARFPDSSSSANRRAVTQPIVESLTTLAKAEQGTLNFTMLQASLPCLAAFNLAASIEADPSLNATIDSSKVAALDEERLRFLRRHIAPLIDQPENPRCSGDGSLINHTDCYGSRGVVDAGWLYSLLDSDLRGNTL